MAYDSHESLWVHPPLCPSSATELCFILGLCQIGFYFRAIEGALALLIILLGHLPMWLIVSGLWEKKIWDKNIRNRLVIFAPIIILYKIMSFSPLDTRLLILISSVLWRKVTFLWFSPSSVLDIYLFACLCIVLPEQSISFGKPEINLSLDLYPHLINTQKHLLKLLNIWKFLTFKTLGTVIIQFHNEMFTFPIRHVSDHTYNIACFLLPLKKSAPIYLCLSIFVHFLCGINPKTEVTR